MVSCICIQYAFISRRKDHFHVIENIIFFNGTNLFSVASVGFFSPKNMLVAEVKPYMTVYTTSILF